MSPDKLVEPLLTYQKASVLYGLGGESPGLSGKNLIIFKKWDVFLSLIGARFGIEVPAGSLEKNRPFFVQVGTRFLPTVDVNESGRFIYFRKIIS